MSADLQRHKTRARAEGKAWRTANPELVAKGFRRCSTCRHVGLREVFSRDRACTDGYSNRCLKCDRTAEADRRREHPEKVRQQQRQWAEKNPTRYLAALNLWKARNPNKVKATRRRRALRTYGLTVDQYEALVRDQKGLCAICKGPPVGRGKKLHVDHDHTTRQVRALLCSFCNRGLGYFKDDPQLLLLAAQYLQDHSAAPHVLRVG